MSLIKLDQAHSLQGNGEDRWSGTGVEEKFRGPERIP
jgi:hypothetical protein